MLATLDGATATTRTPSLEAIRDLAADAPPGITAAVGGGRCRRRSTSRTTIEGDLGRAELIAIPITLILLLFVFGGLVAASLPLLVGVVAVLGTFLSLFVIGSITDVSVYAINLTTALGLGLAIDYSLFIVSRYREELRAGRSVERRRRARRRDRRAHGHDQRPHRGRVAGRAARVPAVLPALVRLRRHRRRAAGDGRRRSSPCRRCSTVVGTRIDSLRIFPHRAPKPEHERVLVPQRRVGSCAGRCWSRSASSPCCCCSARRSCGSTSATPTTGCCRESSPSRDRHDQLRDGLRRRRRRDVPGRGRGRRRDRRRARRRRSIDAGRRRSGRRPRRRSPTAVDATRPTSARTTGGAAWSGRAGDRDGLGRRRGPRRRRSATSTPPLDVSVGGDTAQLVDTKASIGSRLPLALALIVVSTAGPAVPAVGQRARAAQGPRAQRCSASRPRSGRWCGSSRTATWPTCFGFTATGPIDTSMPILMFCIAFGLSMDYEVFLLSRIKEEHDRTGDNDDAVAIGLERTGPHRHRRRPAPVGHVLRLRHLRRQLHQDVRPRPRPRRADGRLRHPRARSCRRS